MILTLVSIYLAITLAIGFYFSRRIRTSTDFALAGRKLPLIITSTAFFATWFGAETVMGASSEFVDGGMAAVIEDPFGASLALLLVGVFMVRYFYRKNIISLGDFYRDKFGKRFEFWSGIFMILTFFGWVAAQFVAFGLILSLLSGLSVELCIGIGAVVVLTYTLAGGMFAISFSDFMQTIVIVGGMLFLAYEFSEQAGGVSRVMESVPDGFFNLLPESDINSISWYFAALMTLALGSLPSQDVFQRMMSAKSESVARNAAILGAVLYLTIALIPLFLVLCARVMMPEVVENNPDAALIELVMAGSNDLVKVLFFGALLSAILSTASAAILAPSVILAENIVKPAMKHKMIDKMMLRSLRYSVVVIGVLSLALSLLKSSIYELVGESSALGVVALFTPLIAGMYDKSPSGLAAMISMLTGTGVWIVFRFYEEALDYPSLLPGLAASALAYIVVKIINRRTNSNNSIA
jgi:Na+/proline symporter